MKSEAMEREAEQDGGNYFMPAKKGDAVERDLGISIAQEIRIEEQSGGRVENRLQG